MQTSSLYKLLQTQLAMLIHKFNYEAFDICKHIHKVQKQVLKKIAFIEIELQGCCWVWGI